MQCSAVQNVTFIEAITKCRVQSAECSAGNRSSSPAGQMPVFSCSSPFPAAVKLDLQDRHPRAAAVKLGLQDRHPRAAAVKLDLQDRHQSRLQPVSVLAGENCCRLSFTSPDFLQSQFQSQFQQSRLTAT